MSRKKPISEAQSGDTVCVDRGLYQHYGIYDEGKVIDFSPVDGNNALQNKQTAVVRQRSLRSFLNGDPGYVDNAPGFHSRKKALKRARAEIGKGQNSYDLLFNNCEHKAREWQTGRKESRQVDDAIELVTRTFFSIFDIFSGRK